ncbi:flagellar biosynthesis anti-sigma factor FlgM [Vibrio sp. 10N.261.55.A7]|uniref:flagellar biosynthesis anti-sigma factor FlgM n=1 Tax=Vibrio sp. 10N.261.55.A7 TaxID=1880851 RepID=UPI000C8565AF|nr:flagellar biosynthesis anti-sigma factor FlgM [Vibrio sp. 10N.261.55.A7]PMK02787.1 flagellar biosynthesis anti-sigma factor FlgM [Vibrio sp. 10N.261.55.A7]
MVNIDNNGNNPTVFNQTIKPVTQTDSRVRDQKQSNAQINEITLEQKACSLESLQQELHQLPEVDLARVNEIRAQLTQGYYSIDLDELASAIKSTYQRD